LAITQYVPPKPQNFKLQEGEIKTEKFLMSRGILRTFEKCPFCKSESIRFL
jgi:hypothetical protein